MSRPHLLAGWAIFICVILSGLGGPGPLWPQPPEKGGAAEGLLAEAEGFFARGENERALRLLERAAQLGPRSYRVQKLLGLELLIRGRYREAALALRRAMALRPPLADRHVLVRALAWARARYRGSRAQSLLFQAAGDEGRPSFQEGLALYYGGQLGAARRAFARAAAAEEDHRSRYFLGLTNYRLGRYREAERNLLRASRLSPSASYREAIAATLSRVRLQLARKQGAAPRRKPPRREVAPSLRPKRPKPELALVEQRLAALARELFAFEARLKTLRPTVASPEEMLRKPFFRKRYQAKALAARGKEEFRRFLAEEKRALARRLLAEVRRRLKARRARHREYYPALRTKLEAKEREGRELVERGERMVASAEGDTDYNREVLEHNRRALAQVREQQAALARYLAAYQRYLESTEADLRYLEKVVGP